MSSPLTLDAARRLAADRQDALRAASRPRRDPRHARGGRTPVVGRLAARWYRGRRRFLDWFDRSVPSSAGTSPC